MSPTQQGGLGANEEESSFAGDGLGDLVAMSPSGVGLCGRLRQAISEYPQQQGTTNTMCKRENSS